MRGNKFLKYTVVQVVERRILVTERYSIEDCTRYISTSATATSNVSKFTNVSDFGTYDGTDAYYSAILSITQVRGNLGSICLANNVQTSQIAPYPTGYCDYRLFTDENNKGLGGGCQSGGDYGMHTSSGKLSDNTEYLFEMELHSNSITGKITKVSDNTVVYNETITPPKDYTNYHFALFLFGAISVTYKEVKVKPL